MLHRLTGHRVLVGRGEPPRPDLLDAELGCRCSRGRRARGAALAIVCSVAALAIVVLVIVVALVLVVAPLARPSPRSGSFCSRSSRRCACGRVRVRSSSCFALCPNFGHRDVSADRVRAGHAVSDLRTLVCSPIVLAGRLVARIDVRFRHRCSKQRRPETIASSRGRGTHQVAEDLCTVASAWPRTTMPLTVRRNAHRWARRVLGSRARGGGASCQTNRR